MLNEKIMGDILMRTRNHLWTEYLKYINKIPESDNEMITLSYNTCIHEGMKYWRNELFELDIGKIVQISKNYH